jgi:ankyrin repeat protein
MAAALRTAASNGDLEMIETLLDVGTNINSYDEQEGTALSKAALSGHHSAVQSLLQKGADPNTGSGRIANIQLSFIPG